MPIPGAAPPMAAPAATMPLVAQGQAAAALGIVKQAVTLLSKALPELPVGSEIHKVVTDSVAKLAKHAPETQGTQGIDMATIRDLQHQAQSAAPMVALMRAMGQHQQPPGAPGAPPAAA